MIPITASIIAGSGTGETRLLRRLGLTLAYVTGLALLYATMGLVAGLTGSLFGTVASDPRVRVGVGVLLTGFGLAMLDVVPVPIPARFLQWVGSLRGGSYPAVFVLGASSGVVAAPCGAPAFAAVLTWVATTGSALWGFVYLFAFSMGMTALLVAVGLFSGALSALPRAGRWMVWIKKGSGIVLLVVAGYFFWGAWQVMR